MKIADEEAEKRRRKKKETERSSSIKPKRLSKHKYPTCTSIRSFKQELILTSNFITCAEYHCLWDAMGLCCVVFLATREKLSLVQNAQVKC